MPRKTIFTTIGDVLKRKIDPNYAEISNESKKATIEDIKAKYLEAQARSVAAQRKINPDFAPKMKITELIDKDEKGAGKYIAWYIDNYPEQFNNLIGQVSTRTGNSSITPPTNNSPVLKLTSKQIFQEAEKLAGNEKGEFYAQLKETKPELVQTQALHLFGQDITIGEAEDIISMAEQKVLKKEKSKSRS